MLCVSRALNKRPLRDIAVARREKEGFGLEADHAGGAPGGDVGQAGRRVGVGAAA